MDLATFRNSYANASGSVECVLILSTKPVFIHTLPMFQPRATQLLHQCAEQPSRPNFCLLLRREERGRKNDAQVSCTLFDLLLHYLTVAELRLLGILEEKHINRGIIIFPGAMTPSARKVSNSFLLLR